MKFQELYKNFMNMKEIHVWGAREGMGELQPLKKHWNYLSFCMSALYGRFLVNAMEFTGNQEFQWNCRKSMEIMEFHEIH